MARAIWDEEGKRFYETGVDRGMLYRMGLDAKYETGVAWDGLTGIDESPEGGDTNDIYADNMKYLSIVNKEKFKATIKAYQSPKEFDVCDGTSSLGKGVTIGQQSRRSFGLSYRTLIGNDVQGEDYGYVIHLVYGGKASPSSRSHSTTNESTEPAELSWEMSTTPVVVNAIDPETKLQFKPTSHLQINSKLIDSAKLTAIEELLYGKDGTAATYAEVSPAPTPDSYDAVTPVGTENPSEEGWFERTGTGTSEDPYVYTVTEDTAVNDQKTYYEFVPGDNPHTEGWYEKDGDVYTLSTDTSVDESKTYYEQTSAGTEKFPTLPSPDDVYAILNA